MSCGCNSGYEDGVYQGTCDADTPYPIISHESVPSLIDNLVAALYGQIEKNVTSGKIVWTIPCDPNNTASVSGIPRDEGEGLLCYFIRVFESFNFASFVNLNSTQTLSNKTLNNSFVSGTINFGSAVVSNGNFSAVVAGRATNIAGGLAGSLPYQTAVNTTALLPTGTAGQVLSANGSGGLQWVTNTAISATATNILNGAASQLVYQTAANTTGFIANGTSGQFLGSNGSSAPSWKTITAANVGAATPQQAIAFAIALS